MSTPTRGFPVTVQLGQFASTTGPSATHGHLTVVGLLDETTDKTRKAALVDLTTAAARLQPLPDDMQLVEPTTDAPAVWLRGRLILAAGNIVYVIEPPTPVGEPRRFMFGGNLAGSDDPRWAALAGEQWVKVNDRVES